MSWAYLLKRVVEIDITTCPQCGGTLTLLAAIEEPTVIAKILSHLGLPTPAPPKAPARLDAFMQTASSLPRFRFGTRPDRLPMPGCPFHTSPCTHRLGLLPGKRAA